MVANKDFKLRSLAQKPNSPANKDFRLRTGTQKDGAAPTSFFMNQDGLDIA